MNPVDTRPAPTTAHPASHPDPFLRSVLRDLPGATRTERAVAEALQAGAAAHPESRAAALCEARATLRTLGEAAVQRLHVVLWDHLARVEDPDDEIERAAQRAFLDRLDHVFRTVETLRRVAQGGRRDPAASVRLARRALVAGGTSPTALDRLRDFLLDAGDPTCSVEVA